MMVMLVLVYRRPKIYEEAAKYVEWKVWPVPLNAMQVGDWLRSKTQVFW